jgi:RNA polymerase sigma-54 factor
MLLNHSQVQSQEQRHLTTAHLAQTMTLLSMTMVELRQKIEAELAANPALEIMDERHCPNCNRLVAVRGPCPICSHPTNINQEEPIVYLSDRRDLYSSSQTSNISVSDLPDDNFTPLIEDLPTYVMRQIAPDLASEDRIIAAHILTSLDDDGLLSIPTIEIAHYHHVPLSRVEKALSLIQHAEPIGVGAHSPQQALLIQIEVLAENRPVPQLAEQIIREEMDNLCRRQYSEIARRLGISQQRIKEIAQFISDNLNPYPARSHWGDIHYGAKPTPPIYIQPDAIISLLDDRDPNSSLVIEVLTPFYGTLHINSLFRQAIHEVHSDLVEQWKSDLEHASLLIKCLQQRNNTMRRLMFTIAKRQRDFILHGDHCLIPMTRACLAGELGVHESTISRAVAGKTVQVPNGQLIPLERFFDRSLHIRTALRQIIDIEQSPLSDSQIMAKLKEQGYDVARRTIAKYRAMEDILPARLRHPHAD